MNVWETEDERDIAVPAVRAQSRPRGGRRSRKNSVSPVTASSPGPMPDFNHNGRRDSKNMGGNEENISPFDPRRFTPTLHANLVAEILNLRRDQEEKGNAIEELEERLFTSRNEIDSLTAATATNAKENRSLKRQLALLEGGTSSALTELAKERDEATETASEMKKRLETAQKKIRSLEESMDRAHELWANDKEAWGAESRKKDTKIHVTENRLKLLLEEVANYQANHPVASEVADLTQHENGSDTSSLHSRHSRHQSITSIRFSMFPGGAKPDGPSLADELNFEDDDELIQLNNEARDSLASFQSHHRQTSHDSINFRGHNYSNSIESLRRNGSIARSRMLANQAVLDKLEGRIAEADEEDIVEKPVYTESATQYSPPPSPVMKATVVSPASQVKIKSIMIPQIFEKEANQRRKRAPVAALSPIEAPEPPKSECMVSAGCQTMDEPPSPPRTPKVESPVLAPVPEVIRDMSTSSTQTEREWILKPEAPSAPPETVGPKQIPFISIHPPTSRPPTPSSPREPLLPQHFKDIGCQVSIREPTYTSEASVQTEEIRTDKRLRALPLHLQPSFITSRPPTPATSNRDSATLNSSPIVVPPPRNPRRMKSNQSFRDIPSSPPVGAPRQSIEMETRDSYPRHNDSGPLSHEKGFISRPPRTSSLFQGFDNEESDEVDEFVEQDQSDSDYTTALSAPRPRKSLRKLRSTTTTTVTEEVETIEEEGNDLTPSKPTFTGGPMSPLRSSPNIPDPKTNKGPERHFDKPLSLVMPPPRQGAMRRTVLVSSGIAAHTGRPRSPSLPMSDNEPPFPIPTRASSRKPPFSVSAPSDGNRSPTRDSWHRRRGGRANSIRKSRSAAALPQVRPRRSRRESRSPPPFSPSTEGARALESPQLPPMPNNEITSPYLPRDMHSSYRGQSGHRKQPSNYTAHTALTANTNQSAQSAGSSVQATSVVDAIAQTMVGEWMFKYVRRRKSFGVAGTNDIDDGVNGARHKRWVWLAPYERAVMWSSKQPTSGSALMGKSGRKLTIQSVLDVKDDNDPPKGAVDVFNRSILILTPARALKFTATTRERHYIWLAALSFLAHSSQAVPEVMAPYPVPPQEFLTTRPPNGARLQKSPLRDSIRVAKGRGPVSTRSGPTTAQSSIHRGTESSIRTGASSRATNDQSAREVTSFHTRMDSAIEEAASPPVVPRFTDRALANAGVGHGRKRSNTGSRIPPPLSFRGFSERAIPTLNAFNAPMSNGPPSTYSSNLSSYGGGHAAQSSTAGMSDRTATESGIYHPSYQSTHQGSAFGQNTTSVSNGTRNSIYGRDSFQTRTSDASSRPGAVVNNFFEAVGTVRMEAFISPIAFSPDIGGEPLMGAEDMIMSSINRGGTNRRRNSREHSRRRRSRNRGSFYGKHRVPNIDYGDYYGGSKTAGEEDNKSLKSGRSSRQDDPFHGF